MDPNTEPHFADIPGLETVDYGTGGRHGRLGGFHVVDQSEVDTQPGEKITSQDMAGEDANVGLSHNYRGARIPGDTRAYEQPVDAASQSQLMPEEEPVDLGAAEQAADDPRHVLRGTSDMASSKGSR